MWLFSVTLTTNLARGGRTSEPPAHDANWSQACFSPPVQECEAVVYRILEAARQVHGSLGPGFLESIYGRALLVELKNYEMRVEVEKPIKVWYGPHLVGRHRLDLVVDGMVIVELKANRGIVAVHLAQMNSYLHATRYAAGLILNFGMPQPEWDIVRRPATVVESP